MAPKLPKKKQSDIVEKDQQLNSSQLQQYNLETYTSLKLDPAVLLNTIIKKCKIYETERVSDSSDYISE
ncbi:unnamed protein product [Cunninghamella echinulata]